MAVKFRYIAFILLLFLIDFGAKAQSVESLENKIESLQKDIKLGESLLKETTKDRKATLNQVSLLQAQINQRENLIKTYQDQINAINKEIQKNRNRISQLEKELVGMRKEYSNMLVITYRNRNKINNLLFIFSSDDFNQAIRRMRYIQELNELVKVKIEEISSAQEEIKDKLEDNEDKKKDKEKVLAREKKEQSALLADRDELNKDIAALKKKEKEIQKDIDKKEKEAKKIQKDIEKIIAEEIRKAKERESTASANKTESIDYKLSGNFAQNKGKLLFPVEQGIITRKYGLSQHPTQKKVTVNNNGIDITTKEGAKARVVFDGKVCFITNQGSNNAVLVRHGLYFTLYSNLDKVYVKTGQELRLGDNIGRVHTDANDGKTILHFEIWQENRKTVNPALWLKK